MSARDGGPAFPVSVGPDGRKLRDYFAGQALAGGLAYCGDGQRGSWHNNATPEDVASMCYEYADAMLAARERGGDDA